MSWHVTLYSLLLALSAAVSFAVAVIAWRSHSHRSGLAFTVLMVAATLWASASALQVTTTGLSAKLLFRTVAYVGHNTVPIALLSFALAYTGHRRLLTRRNIALLSLVPMFTALVLVPTNALRFHRLVWQSVGLRTADGLVFFDRTFGPAVWVTGPYNYALVIAAFALFVWMAIGSHGPARKQGLTLIAGLFPPFVTNVLWVGGWTTIDFTPIAFTVTGLAFTLAIYRYHLFDLRPIARNTVLDATSDGYVVIDVDDRIVDMNATARTLARVDRSFVGHPLADVFPACAALLEARFDPSDGERTPSAEDGDLSVDESVERAIHRSNDPVAGLDSDSSQRRTELAIETDGTVNYFDLSVSSLRHPGEDGPVGQLLLLRDVTERRAIEGRYQALIERSSDPVTVLDEDGRYQYTSPAVTVLLGYEADELRGRSVLDFIHPDDHETVVTALQEELSNPDEMRTVEYRMCCADGSVVWIESRGRNLLDEPLIDGIVVNSRDITERKRRERALHEQNARLDEFASVVSHDLRNPLNVVQGRTELARETGEAVHFDAVERATTQMESFISDLLTLAREGKTVGETSTVEFGAVVREAWETVETDGATLLIATDGTIEADATRLSELLANLFQNSVEHGSTSGRVPSDSTRDTAGTEGPAPPLTVRAGLFPGGFYVEDDGSGIDSDHHDQLFERGFTTSASGTGFGLTIVDSIAAAHGWEARVTDAETGGARFVFDGVDCIPAVDADPDRSP